MAAPALRRPLAQTSRVSAGVLVVSGYGLRIAVERGHLVVNDGIADERRTLRFSRVAPGFRRLVVIGHTGSISLDALRWIHDVGAAFVQLDSDGQLIAVGGAAGVRDPRVCRGQARARDTGLDLAVARYLLATKVRGQASVSERFTNAERTTAFLRQAAADIEHADSLAKACVIESAAAVGYWDTWSPFPTQFIARDRAKVPAHWHTFGTRASPLTQKAQKAINPANALLNYLYAVLESETSLALSAVGCDPTLGVVHVDRGSRRSFALDVMEPVRPHVDTFVLDLLSRRLFSRADFFETRDGWCKLMPSLAQAVAETASTWAGLVAPIAERVATLCAHGADRRPTTKPVGEPKPTPFTLDNGTRLLRTPLTWTNNRLAGPRPPRWGQPTTEAPSSLLSGRCRSCGTKVSSRRRMYCDICLAALEQRPCVTGVVRSSERRKAAGIADGRSSSETAAKRWPKIVARQAEHYEWESEHGRGPSRTVFLDELTPRLRAVPIDVLISATGLSRVMCYRIRRGFSVPHWRHWDAIRSAVAAYEATPMQPQEWERLPKDTYEHRIAPFLAAIPTKEVRAATGFSEAYVSLVKRRHYTPHRRHWPALLQLVDASKARRAAGE